MTNLDVGKESKNGKLFLFYSLNIEVSVIYTTVINQFKNITDAIKSRSV